MNTRTERTIEGWTAHHHPVLLTISHKWITPKLQRRAQAARDEMYAAVRALTVQVYMARARALRQRAESVRSAHAETMYPTAYAACLAREGVCVPTR